MNALTKKAIASLPSRTPEVRKKLVKVLGTHIPGEDAGHFDETIIRRMTDAQWELAKKRGRGDPRIDIYYETVNGHRKTMLDAVSDDMAFLVDSIAATINRNNFLIDILIHPIFYVKYGAKGDLVDISDKPRDDYQRQSHIHVQIKNTLSQEQQEKLREDIMAALEDVAVCNRDWRKMLDKLKEARNELAKSKADRPKEEIDLHCAFLDYLFANNFTLLGYREYEFIDRNGKLKSRTVPKESLGLLHDDVRPAFISETEEGLPRNLQELRKSLPPVSVSKTNRLSSVHRRVPMDAIAIKTYGPKGNVKGEKLFLGLFTSVTYSRSVSDVPKLREKVDEVIKLSRFLPGSHNSKALRHILEKYPRDELFQITPEDLLDTALDILRLQERQRIALFMRRDPFGRYISCLVYVPRDRFGTTLRKRITGILEQELNGVCSSFTIGMDDSVFARIIYTIDVSQKNPPEYDVREIEAKIHEIGMTWPERLAAIFAEIMNDDQDMTRLTLKYGDAFPAGYTSRYRAKQAAFDITKLEQTEKSGALELDLYRLNDDGDRQLRLKFYNQDKPLNLSDVLPILENMDLRAVSELPFEVKPAHSERSIWIQDFLLETSSAATAAAAAEAKQGFEQAFAKIWYNDVENDSLNRLVLRAGLDYREVTILRTYVRYLRQIGSPFGRAYIEEALVQNPQIAGTLAEMFTAIFDPAETKDRAIITADFLDRINQQLEKVDFLDQDRILRAVANLIDSTVRTNYFQKGEDGQPKTYLSIKLESARVNDMPEPKPFREIFVYSPRMEGVHLRSDKISRGGIRWSDRHEDFRTEVLGLVKAQQVKNAVIVPMGAKGGFIVKRPPKERSAFLAEGIECYKILICGLLDITDNLKNGKIFPPKDVARLDADDPYLVVAADKGTASFSDIANSISLQYGFWLGDAFASGGSVGYDHKKMGITARGAWESVKMHFRQLNHDVQTKPFDVVGIGDMAGDVFGNGLLLSNQIHLVGAFNHIHIFCDPAPDAAESFKERQRMFKNALGWDQYDTKKLAKGGRIYNRSEKSIALTPEIQKRFDLPKDKVPPADLMRAMLKARTDLIYLGGIGTFIKSTKQTHAEAGDKTNDALRVDATEIRAKVIAEGANLGVTQLARIEYAEKGGRINTDFLDNSAGVDTSDHEVNIKILFADIMSAKNSKVDVAARNKTLEKMTGEVAELVLRNNYQQALAISLAELQARENLKLHEEFIQELEKRVGLSRVREGLPSAQIIEQRLRLGKGLTRPELCILLAYAKIDFTQDLLASPIPDSADMQTWALTYFPEELQEKYSKEIERHKLRRELVAMAVANSIVNRLGPSFVKNCSQKTGASVESIARAYVVTRKIFRTRDLSTLIESLDNKVPAEVQLKAMREVSRMNEHAITWFLTHRGEELRPAQDIEYLRACFLKLRDNMDKLVTPELASQIAQRMESGLRDGLTKEIARWVALLPVLASSCDIAKIAADYKNDLDSAARIYFHLGTRFHFDWIRQQAAFIASDSHWQSEAVASLIDNLYRAQAGLARLALKATGGKADKIEQWLATQRDKVDQIDEMFEELRQSGSLDLPMLVIAEKRLRALYDA